MKKTLLIIIWSITMRPSISAQSKAGIEEYNYVGSKLSGTGMIVPMLHIQSAKNWYAELRYNYEDVQTFSLFVGKTFDGGSGVQYSVTPIAGFSAGVFTGASFGFNMEADWNKVYLSSQTQYSMAVKKNRTNFFFTWSELGYNVSSHFFAGLAMQYTRQTNARDFEPGFLAGLNFKNLSFPVYIFSPFRPGRYFVLGVNYEYNLRKKKRSV